MENSTTVIQEVVIVAYKRWSFTKSSSYKALSGKILVFWSLMRGLVAYTMLLHMEVRLYS